MPGPVTQDPVEAVVFDFDGVLARSIEVHAVAYQLVLRPLGVHVEPGQVYLREGARSETIVTGFLEDAGREAPEDLVARLSELKQAVFERIGAPTLFPWARTLVEAVDERGFPMAICTGTHRDNVPAIAGALVDRFDAIAAEDAYEHDKPHPEPFETAAEGLGVAPERCVALENAPRGVESAKRAGMFVTAAATTLGRSALEEAHRVVDEPLDALDILPEKVGAPLRA